MIEIKKDALAIYKGQAALILDTGKKLEIKLSSGELKKVRDKDITVIHQGPVKTLSFQEVDCDIEEVWTLLQEESTFSLIELSEFLYGDSSSNSVFNAYNILQKNLYFSGDTESINCNTREYIESEIEKEQLKEQKSQEFSESIIRLSKKEWSEKDQTALREIEELALEQRLGSKILKTLGIKETSIDAQRFLIEINYWKIWTNPYPGRMGVSLKSPDTDEEFQVTKNPLDLTYLNSYAIDDEGSRDPDDALSLDGDYKLWVHITDVASIVKPDSKSDNEASSKGANLYLPDQTVHMLPAKITELQALGHPDGNNALSFLFEFDKDYNIINREIHLSRVIVDRVSYEEVESQRDSDKFRQFYTIAEKLKERRLQNGAVSISLPEVKIRVNDLNEIDIKPISGVESRNVVSEFMLLAGESAAIFCFNKGIPIPYATQQASDSKGIPDTDLASMFNWRRKFKRGETKFKPESHFGLGLEMYTRALLTSRFVPIF